MIKVHRYELLNSKPRKRKVIDFKENESKKEKAQPL
jgi:hypothetical protein